MARSGFFRVDTIVSSSKSPNAERNALVRAEYSFDVVMCRNKMEFRVLVTSAEDGSLCRSPVEVSA